MDIQLLLRPGADPYGVCRYPLPDMVHNALRTLYLLPIDDIPHQSLQTLDTSLQINTMQYRGFTNAS